MRDAKKLLHVNHVRSGELGLIVDSTVFTVRRLVSIGVVEWTGSATFEIPIGAPAQHSTMLVSYMLGLFLMALLERIVHVGVIPHGDVRTHSRVYQCAVVMHGRIPTL